MLKFFTQEIKFPYYFIQFQLKRKGFIQYRDRYNQKPIMVVPGMWTSDAYTKPLRSSLALTGATVYGWNLGKNTGDIKNRYFLRSKLLGNHCIKNLMLIYAMVHAM